MADSLLQVPYAKAITSKYPEQVVIAVVKTPEGVYNPITLGWTMIASQDPPMMAIGLGPQRYSCECIRAAKEFTIAFPSVAMAKDALYYGTRSGRDESKIEKYGSATMPCEHIDSIMFTDAVANFECRLAGECESGDHITFFGEILASWINPDKPERLYTLGSGYKMGRAIPEVKEVYRKDLFE